MLQSRYGKSVLLSLAGLLTLLACGGGSPSSLVASPPDVAFGDVVVGTTVSRNVTLSNTSVAPVTIVDVSASGSSVGATSPALPMTLAAGERTTLAVRLAPQATGDVSGTLVVRSVEKDALATVTYEARAVLPSSDVTVAPTSLDLGDVAAGESAARTVTLTNGSSHSVAISGVTSSAASVTAPGLGVPLSLAPGASQTFDVTFSPTAAGTVAGFLAFYADPSKPVAVLEYRGAGTAAAVPALSATPTQLDFHDVAVGDSSTQSVTLANDTAQRVTLSDLAVSGAGLSVSGLALPVDIAPGASVAVSVRFTPANVGPVSGSVSAMSAGGAKPLAVVPATANAVAAPTVTGVTVRSATVEASNSVQLVAEVAATGTVDTAVTWSVEAGSLGTVDAASGVFTAAATAGTARVVATSVADATKKGVGVVTVTPPVLVEPAALTSVAISLSPTTGSVTTGGTKQFTGTVTGTTNTAVWYGVVEGAAGGTITSTGLYTAPSTPGTYHVRTRSQADSTKTATATITVTAPSTVGISLSPATVSVTTGGTKQFTGTVTGTTNTAVWYGVVEGAAGGTITSTGLYTAPSTPGTYHVRTRSQADSTKTATATITVTAPSTVGISLSPATASVTTGGTKQFTGTVTGTTNTAVWYGVVEGAAGGTITSAGFYTAPATAGTYHVIARSAADATKTATATVMVTAPAPVVAVSVSPTTAALTTGGAKTFTANVTGSTNTAVTWSVQEGAAGGTITSAGVYTAPATAGTYRVVAKSVADTTKTATATVTVTGPATAPLPSGVVPAFPGAEGAGALSKGGRSGVVYTVNTLSDTTNATCAANNSATTCSLRDCLTRSGPRTCVFAVGGTITISGSPINVVNPYLTVAGQTAPGGGILIRGQQYVAIRTHDVVWRYTRMRRGHYADTPAQAGDVFDILGGAYNVVFDHNSLSWSEDEMLDISGYSSHGAEPKRVTVSWNLLAEPLGDGHQVAALHGANSAAVADRMVDLDWHHNVIANSGWRNILASTKGLRFVNNVVYNWKKWATKVGGGIQADIIGNLYKRGPLGSTTGYTHEVEAWPTQVGTEATGTMSLHVVGNKGPNNPDPTNDNWSTMVRQTSNSNTSEIGLLPTTYRRTSPLASVGVPITVQDVRDVEATIGATIGAYRRLACDGSWVAARDAVDARVVSNFVNGTGISSLLLSETTVGGFPTIAAGTRCLDADSDGMPDAWETVQGLNPKDASDRNGTSVRAPWTNLEAYLAGK